MKVSKEVKVGLLATTALIIIYVGLNFLKGRELFSTQKLYYTTYNNSAGLSTSSPILVNGMVVGRIRNIQLRPDQGYRTLVTFAVKKSITLTDTTKARLVSRSLLGEKAIDLLIEPGNPLKKFDTVSGEVEQGLGEAFINSTLPTLANAKGISELASQFLTSLVENTDRINSILTNLEATAQGLRQTVKENQAGVGKATHNLASLSAVFADSKDGIGPLLVKFNQLMEGVEGQEVKVAAAKLTNILDSLEQMLNRPVGKKNSLSKLLYDDSFYKNLNQTLLNLDRLLVDLKAHPWRYVNFSVFGKKQSHE